MIESGILEVTNIQGRLELTIPEKEPKIFKISI